MSFSTRIYKSNGKAYDRTDVTSETLEAAIAAAPADCHSFEVRDETGVIVKHGFTDVVSSTCNPHRLAIYHQ